MGNQRNNWFVSRPREVVKSKKDKRKLGAWKYIRGDEPDEYEAMIRLEEETIWDPKTRRYHPRIYEHTNY